ncbi:GNAT family N-acetyltransferase [Acidisoma sp. C75]
MDHAMNGRAARMLNTDLRFERFLAGHIPEAVGLSRAAGWPHRAEDWAFLARLSEGFAVLAEGGRLVGTAFMTPFGPQAATINTVIVAEAMRGQGLGRRLMLRCLEAAGGRLCRLIATAEGLPLYEKLGFQTIGSIVQHQGVVARARVPSLPPGMRLLWPAGAEMRAECARLDRAATGMDRAALIAGLFEEGRIACLMRGDSLVGYAALRAFGRGEVAGPIIAADLPGAEALLGLLMAACEGRFLRVDTLPQIGLVPRLQAHGLMPVGGGIGMRRGDAPAAQQDFHLFALASQALG